MHACTYAHTSTHSEAAVEEDLLYMLQPSRVYVGDNINVFGKGKSKKKVANSLDTHVNMHVACLHL